ncbi:MAG: methyltransferase domain-containing protein [Candidatus Omnitrophica bacterium]|nr:methyltransferase domain-containing protein [Candidatus Omnitrophota bacterium]
MAFEDLSQAISAGERVLDVGCGAAKREGTIGIDMMAKPGVDIVHDLNVYPWPIQDSQFDRVLFTGSLECLDSVLKSMDEAHRVLKPNGRVEIHTTHFASSNSHWDPLQKWHFSYYTFDYFTEGFDNPVYTDRKYRMIRKELMFRRKWGMGQLLYKLSPRRYEKYHAYRFPPYRQFFELQAIK